MKESKNFDLEFIKVPAAPGYDGQNNQKIPPKIKKIPPSLSLSIDLKL